MSCLITQGMTLGCKDSQGGIQYLYIANMPNYDEIVVDGNGKIVSLDLAAVPVAITFFKYETPKQTSSLTETITATIENGTVLYDQQVTFIFNKMEAATRNKIMLLAENQSLLVVVKDANNAFWVVGVERGAELISGSQTTGVAFSDRNGGEIVLQGLEPQSCFEALASFVGE